MTDQCKHNKILEIFQQAVANHKAKIPEITSILKDLNIRGIPHFQNAIDRCLRKCHRKRNEPIIMAVCGETKCGKNSFINELLGGEISIPMLTDSNHSCFVRIIHSQEKTFRAIRMICEVEVDDGLNLYDQGIAHIGNYSEESIYEKKFDSQEELDDLFEEKLQNPTPDLLIELCLPLEILKLNIRLVKCPALNDPHNISSYVYGFLAHQRASIFLYLFDCCSNIRLANCGQLDILEATLKRNQGVIQRLVEWTYILVANKVDLVMEPEMRDSAGLQSMDPVEYTQSANQFISQAAFVRSGLNSMNLLPVFPVSTEMLYDHRIEYSPSSDRFLIMFYILIEKVCFKIETSFAMWCADQLITEKVVPGDQISSIIDTFFTIKSLNLPPHLKRVLLEECDTTLIVDFTGGFCMKKANYEESCILFTEVSGERMYEKDFLAQRQRIYHAGYSKTIYSHEKQIFIIYFEPFHQRLLDLVEELDLQEMLTIVQKLYKLLFNGMFSLRMKHMRPDNIYINHLKLFHLNQDIPIELPLILKDGMTAGPLSALGVDTSHSEGLQTVQTFGWLMWILVEGSGIRAPATTESFNIINQWLDQLNESRYRDELCEQKFHLLKKVIRLCWMSKEENAHSNWKKVGSILDQINTEDSSPLSQLSGEATNPGTLDAVAAVHNVPAYHQPHQAPNLQSSPLIRIDMTPRLAETDTQLNQTEYQNVLTMMNGNKFEFENSIIEELGRGTFGRVVLRKVKNSDQKFAVKYLKNGFVNEANIQSPLNHKHIIRCYGYGRDSRLNQQYLVLEWAEFGSLRTVLLREAANPICEELFKWPKEILKGLEYLHENLPQGQQILHCDLKSENVLIGQEGKERIAKISDFGLSLPCNRRGIAQDEQRGTIPWMAPEVRTEKRISEKSDIWSFGMILFEILKRKTPYVPTSTKNISRSYCRRMRIRAPLLDLDTPTFFQNLYEGCTKTDPNDRDSIQTVLDKYPKQRRENDTELNAILLELKKYFNKRNSDEWRKVKEMVKLLKSFYKDLSSKVIKSIGNSGDLIAKCKLFLQEDLGNNHPFECATGEDVIRVLTEDKSTLFDNIESLVKLGPIVGLVDIKYEEEFRRIALVKQAGCIYEIYLK